MHAVDILQIKEVKLSRSEKNPFFSLPSNRLRQPDAQDRRWQADDDPVRAGGHPAHAPLHDQHRPHTRLQLQVHLQQVLQVGKERKRGKSASINESHLRKEGSRHGRSSEKR